MSENYGITFAPVGGTTVAVREPTPLPSIRSHGLPGQRSDRYARARRDDVQRGDNA